MTLFPLRFGLGFGLLGMAAVAGLGACAQVSVQSPAPPALFQDARFASPSGPVPTARDVFRLSPEMLGYAARELGRGPGSTDRSRDPRKVLIDALYNKQRMQLQYDSSLTRDAQQAFADRAGNCLSLVIMTAAFAKHMGLPVVYQSVDAPDFYLRSGGLTMASSHVNLVLTATSLNRQTNHATSRGLEDLTVDFLPQNELRGQRTVDLAESTIVAMFLNNRAVELLAAERMDDAYAHARAALQEAPTFLASANTLGVIYTHRNLPSAAAAAFAHVLEREPDHLSALSNLAQLKYRLGHLAEAQLLQQRLSRLQPVAPFQYFNEGREAMAQGEYLRARDLFLRELRLQPYQEEVHFWAAQAYWRVGDMARAARHLAHAAEYSNTPMEHERYVAKLAYLRDHAASAR